ncbi:phosphoribosylglycinamide formyltransferase [Flavobacteriaceae bacterium]|nr:phosphoribosylglycinamide formyltransferase [Flavobacteriaceae bacterium]
MNSKKIILFASGSGSNFKKICEYFKNDNTVSIELLISNNPKAKALQIAESFNIKTLVIDKQSFYNSDKALMRVLKINPSLIVLAGFLWKIPSVFIVKFTNKIINIHPALLPKFGGKGMYGMHVHNAVIINKEIESGITIHYVNENYDEGSIIFQKKIKILKSEDSLEISKRILKLEHEFFPIIIQKVLNNG